MVQPGYLIKKQTWESISFHVVTAESLQVYARISVASVSLLKLHNAGSYVYERAGLEPGFSVDR